MPTIKGLRARLRALLQRKAAERELDEELRFHIEMETEKNVRAGMNPADARRRALRDFGGVEPTKEAHRDVRGRFFEELAADTRYALRTLRRAPPLIRGSPRRYSLCPSPPAPRPGARPRRHPHPGARHWGQHDDLLRCECRRPPTAAIRAARSVGDAVGREPREGMAPTDL